MVAMCMGDMEDLWLSWCFWVLF